MNAGSRPVTLNPSRTLRQAAMPTNSTRPPRVRRAHAAVSRAPSCCSATYSSTPRKTPLRRYSERSQRMVGAFGGGKVVLSEAIVFPRGWEVPLPARRTLEFVATLLYKDILLT